jgi:hypothetical protein
MRLLKWILQQQVFRMWTQLPQDRRHENPSCIFDIKKSNAYLKSVIQQCLRYLWYDRPIQEYGFISDLASYSDLTTNSLFLFQTWYQYLCISHLIYKIPLHISANVLLRISHTDIREPPRESNLIPKSLPLPHMSSNFSDLISAVYLTWHPRTCSCLRPDI